MRHVSPGLNPNFSKIWFNTRRIVTPGKGVGSGCLVNYLGSPGRTVVLVTNAHVVGGYTTVTCQDMTGPTAIERSAELLAIDYAHDLAVLRVIWEPQDNIPEGLTLGSCPRLGDLVHLCGFPAGVSTPRLCQGIVSGYDATRIEGHEVESLVVQAPVNQGSSGGPVCDSEGRLIGIVVAMIPRLRRNVSKPKSAPARAAVKYMEMALNPVDGLGFILNPADIGSMLASYRLIQSLGDNRTNIAPVVIPFPRKAFVQLQREIADIEPDELPKDTSCIGPFNIPPSRDSISLGFYGTTQRRLAASAEWFDVLAKHVPQFHFYLRGYMIVAYHKSPRYARGIWVDRVLLNLGA